MIETGMSLLQSCIRTSLVLRSLPILLRWEIWAPSPSVPGLRSDSDSGKHAQSWAISCSMLQSDPRSWAAPRCLAPLRSCLANLPMSCWIPGSLCKGSTLLVLFGEATPHWLPEFERWPWPHCTLLAQPLVTTPGLILGPPDNGKRTG